MVPKSTINRHSLRQMIRLSRIAAKLSKKQYERAQSITRAGYDSDRDFGPYHLVLADLALFDGNYGEANSFYRSGEKLIKMSLPVGNQDRRFLLAYLNFRLRAIEEKAGGANFDKSPLFARKINDLPAKVAYKDIFLLPE